MDEDLNNPWNNEDELEIFQELLGTEAEFMASENYHQNPTASLRRMEAIEFILTYYRETPNSPYDPFIPLLALTYFDRFFSRLTPEEQSEPDMMMILICCISLATKKRTQNFYLLEFLETNDFPPLELMDVQNMELRISFTLNWRMRTVTAFCFTGFFVRLLNIDDQARNALKNQAVENVLRKMYTDITYTQFKPSILAASALVAESVSSGPRIDLRQAFAPYVDMDDLNRCSDLIATMMVREVVNSIQETYDGDEDEVTN